jgi:integral membrane sensor domain MASE1
LQHVIVALVVAVAYIGLAFVSKAVTYAPGDAWTVWLASGIVFGCLLAAPRPRWPGILGGGFLGAVVFAVTLELDWMNALGYGVIEVITAGGAALIVSKLCPLPLGLTRARELAAMIFAGALPLALAGGVLATAWSVAAGSAAAGPTFRIWVLSNFIGTLLVAPVIVAWAGFRLRRSGGMTMTAFASGAIACALFLGTMQILFDADVEARFGSMGASLTYAPIVFMALVGLLWGTRGATLTAFLGALIAIVNTGQHEGPFADTQGLLGDPELEVQAYALAIALTGLLIAVLDAGKRIAIRDARAWQARFSAAIGAHRLIAYEWDPPTNRIVLTGDANALLGVPAERIATLADWLGHVDAGDREAVTTRFDERVRGQGEPDMLAYVMRGADGALLEASDEARVIRDHDGQLHRVVGIVRITPAARAAVTA